MPLLMSSIYAHKVKIVATLGPASDAPDRVLALAKAGVNMFRINLSHATKEEIDSRFKNVREAERVLGVPLSILGDLAGPKIRIGTIPSGMTLEGKKTIDLLLTVGERQVDIALPVPFPQILKNLRPGNQIYLGDGMAKLLVEKTIPGGVRCVVTVPGPLRSRMGFSAEGLVVDSFMLSAKDKRDVADMCARGADAIAISFVQTAKDVLSVKRLLPKKNPPMLIAKIETVAGVENVESILDAADGLMVARGDLGLSVELPDLPHHQKDFITLSLRKAKPVITATHMLESMTTSPMPTRAEVTDVANAILDGTDAIMLSGETATGRFPEEVVKTMSRIAHRAASKVHLRSFKDEDVVPAGISDSAVSIAHQIKAKLLVVFTETGATARRIARHRPDQIIIALSPRAETIRQLNLSWGVYPIQVGNIKDIDSMITLAKEMAKKNPVCKLKKGDAFVVAAGVPFGKSGTTNLVLVEHA